MATIREAAKAIQKTKTAMLIEGMPGCGKTEGTRAELINAGYRVQIIACQNIPSEDVARFPIIDQDTKTVTWADDLRWNMGSTDDKDPRPVAYILDELFKAAQPVIDAFLPLVHTSREFAGRKYRDDTRVAVTANPVSMRLGDKRQSHMTNRMIQLKVDNPNLETARQVMIDCQYDGRIIEWVGENSHALVSYQPELATKSAATELANYYGWTASDPSAAFCSLRSMQAASDVLKGNYPREGEKSPILQELLAGAIGPKAAASLTQYLNHAEGFVSIEDILANPERAPLSKSLLSQRATLLGVVGAINQANWEALLCYVDRMHKEVQSMMGRMLMYRSDTNVIGSIPQLSAKVINQI